LLQHTTRYHKVALKHHPDRHSSNANSPRPPSPRAAEGGGGSAKDGHGGGGEGGEDKDEEAEGTTHSAFQDILTAYETLCTAKELLNNEASAYQVGGKRPLARC
jgi:DnaJ-class molecular chaperone